MQGKPGDTGSSVGDIQQAIIEAGGSIDQGELTSSTYGPSTIAAVQNFQQNHVDPRGRTLTVDGFVGPVTSYALEHPGGGNRFISPGWRFDSSDAPANSRLALQTAVDSIGIVEVPDGSNQVPGNPFKNGTDPWCAYFVSFCFGKLSPIPFPVMASAYKVYEWGKATGRLIAAKDAKVGDLWIVVRGDLHGHIEMIIGTSGTETLYNVGGNVGNAVRGTVRTRSGATYFVRPVG